MNDNPEGPKYRKFTGNYAKFIQAIIPNQAADFLKPLSKEAYASQIYADFNRESVIELRQPAQSTAIQSKRTIYNPHNWSHYPNYTQSDYSARFIYNMLALRDDKLLEERLLALKADDENFSREYGFGYIDDQGTLCALGIGRHNHEPNANYFINVIRDINLPYEQRIVEFITSDSITINSLYPDMKKTLAETCLAETGIKDDLRTHIGSESIYQLFSTLFDEQNRISEQHFDKLIARLENRYCNLDLRDTYVQHLPSLFQYAKELNEAECQQVTRQLEEDFVNFWANDAYGKLVQGLLEFAKEKTPTEPGLISALQDLLLEHLIVQLYYDVKYNLKSSCTFEGMSDECIGELMGNFTPELAKERFRDQCNHFHRMIHFNQKKEDLITEIHFCLNPSLQKYGQAELEQKISQDRNQFSKKKIECQYIELDFIKALASFIRNPADKTYEPLKALYGMLGLETTKLEKTRTNLEIAKYNVSIEALRDDCTHPYVERVRSEITYYIKNSPAFPKLRIEEQRSINELLLSLNEFVKENSAEKIEALEKKYQDFSLAPFSAEARAQLLLPAHIAAGIENGSYPFDTQGQIVILDSGTAQKQRSAIWSIDASLLPEALTIQFRAQIFQNLRKQVSEEYSNQILDLFFDKKYHLFPLQRSLEIFLHQVAQIYTEHIEPPLFSDEMCQIALSKALSDTNNTVIETLAKALVSASFDSNSNILFKTNIDCVNTKLKEAQATLFENSKGLLINNLKKQISRSAATIAASASEPSSPLVLKDIDPSFSTELSFYFIGQKYVWSRIDNLDCVYKKNPVRILSNPVEIFKQDSSEDDAAFFIEGLKEITAACKFNGSEPVTYYLYDAAIEEIEKSIMAIHSFNRESQTMCQLQIYHLTEPEISLRHPYLIADLISEITLLVEMTLCQQINSRLEPTNEYELKNYKTFLQNPGTLFPAHFFAGSPQGRRSRNTIAELKNQWKKNIDLDPDNCAIEDLAAKALQKMLAFDLHYNPRYSIVIQTLSLSIAKQAVIDDKSATQSALIKALGFARILELRTLPEDIAACLACLATSTTQDSAKPNSDRLIEKMEDFYTLKNNAITLLPIGISSVKAAISQTPQGDILRTQDSLESSQPGKQSSNPNSFFNPQAGGESGGLTAPSKKPKKRSSGKA